MTETKLGHFVLLDNIGEGGMGRVFKARDTRLERLVAVKVLPESRLADADRRARFVQEAKAASALNHPNIITIHDIGEQDGQTYIVMELVDGKALDELILPKGMRMIDALRIAPQLADALATAHTAGIVHRDLKPGNIMVDSQGRVKVLDFGLAKLMAPAATTGDETITVAMHKPATELGAILGSVPYMSPEQAEGKPVDARSDIFSFGAVLYEMISGKRAFGGESRLSTLAAIVEKDPKPLSEITSSTPPELERLVARCPRKDVNRRRQHMADVKLALAELREESESGKTAAHAPRTDKARCWLWPAVAIAAVVTAIGGAWALWRQKPVAAPQQSQMTRLSPDDDASYNSPGISPDGKFVVYSSDRGGNKGKEQLWLQPVGGGDPIQLTHFSDQCVFPRFTPNGLSIVYQRRGNEDSFIDSIPFLGGQSRQLALIKGSRGYSAPVVAPDGSRVAFFDLASLPWRLLTVPLEGGEPREVAAYDRLKKDMRFGGFPLWTSDSRHLVVYGRLNQANDDVVVIPLGEGEVVETGAQRLLEQAGAGLSFPSEMRGDRLMFSGQKENQTHVWELRMSAHFQPMGPPRQLTFGNGKEDVSSVSGSGLAAVQSSQFRSDLYWMPADTRRGVVTGPTRRLTADGRYKTIIQSSGRLLVIYIYNQSKVVSIALRDVESGQERLVTTWETSNSPRGPLLLFDNKQLIESFYEGDRTSIQVRLVDSAGTPRVVCHKCGGSLGVTPDPRYAFLDSEERRGTDPRRKIAIHLLDLETGQSKPWLSHPTDSLYPYRPFGENANWVIMYARKPGSAESRLYLVPRLLDGPPISQWIEAAGPIAKSTLFNGTRSNLIYFRQGKDLMTLPFDPARRRFATNAVKKVKMWPASTPELAADDVLHVGVEGIVFAHREARSSVWLMKLPD